MKLSIVFFLFFLVGCSSESPRDRAKRYIGYVDRFYVDFDKAQEKKLDEIIDQYFELKKDDYTLNKKMYDLLKTSLDQDEKMKTAELQKIINKKFEYNKKIVPIQLKSIAEFFDSLTAKQKKKVLSALEKLKGKSARFRFWLGEK